MTASEHRFSLTMTAIASAAALLLTSCAGDDSPEEGTDSDAQAKGTDSDGADPGEGDQLAILAMNDFHGGLATARELACTVETQREAYPDHLLVSAGDDVGASQFESSIQDDEPTLDFFNALEVDASALGNHEFDEGYADITDRLQPHAEFDHLSANLFEADSDERAADPYEIYEVGGLEVAVIGAVTDDTPELVVAEGVADVEFRDPIDSVNEVIAEELEEVDVVVAAFHEGSPSDADWGEVPEDDWAQRLQQDLAEEVDVVLDGHTHNEYGYLAEGLAVVQTGANAANLGQVLVTVDPETGEVTAHEPELLPVADADLEACADFERFTAAEEVVTAAEDYAEEAGSEVLTGQEGDLTTAWGADRAEYVDGIWTSDEAGHGDERGYQSVLGGFTADFIQELDWPEEITPDFSLINAGGIRDDIRQDDSGEVTLRDAFGVMPFNNRMSVVELTGEQVYDLLEQQWGEEGYHQLGFSSALSYTFDEEAEAGERITSVSVDGELVDESGTYLVGVQEFLADGGDGFTVLAEGQDRHNTEIIDSEVWPDYLSEQETLDPDYGQRAFEVSGFDPAQPVSPGDELSFEVGAVHSMSLGAPEVIEVQAVIEQGEQEHELAAADYTVEEGQGSAEFTADIPGELESGDAVLVLTGDTGGTRAEVPITVE